MSILAESPIYHRIRDEGRQLGRQEGRQEGRRQGLQEGLKLALEFRFGNAARALFSEVDRCQSVEKLEEIEKALRRLENLDELRARLQ